MDAEKLERLKDYLQNKMQQRDGGIQNMMKKYMYLLLREGRSAFESALKINYSRPGQKENLEKIRDLVNFLRKDLRIEDDRSIAYALGLASRILSLAADRSENSLDTRDNETQKKQQPQTQLGKKLIHALDQKNRTKMGGK